MRDKLSIIFFMVFVMVFIVITAMVALHFWPNFISPHSFSDVIVLFGILMAVIATINIGIFELNKREIDARANDCLAEVRKIAEEEQIAINATANYTAAQALWVYYYQHKTGNRFWKERFQQLERRIEDLEKKEIRQQKVDVALAKEVENYYKEYLNEAIRMADRSVQAADRLNILKYEEIICKCKNNLAFFLAARGNDSDAGRARDLGNYNYQVVTSERSKTLKNPYIYQATWALVLWRFYKKDEVSRKEAYRMAKELIGNAEIPPAERDRLKDRWTSIRGEGKTFDQLMKELESC